MVALQTLYFDEFVFILKVKLIKIVRFNTPVRYVPVKELITISLKSDNSLINIFFKFY